MFGLIYSCLAHEHDARLVALAAFLCIFGCFTTANLFVYAREARARRRLALGGTAASVFGASVWATHFVAELAFEPGLPLAYDTGLTALSLLIAVLMTAAGMLVALQAGRPVTGGLLIGAAVAAMHYSGMAALRIPADIRWNETCLSLSVVVGTVGSAAAFDVLSRGPAWRHRAAATGLLVLAICGLHFIAMAAVVLVPNPAVAVPQSAVAPQLLAIVVAAVCIGILALGMSLSIVEEQSARHALQKADVLRLSREHLARAQRISGVGSIVRDLRAGVSECSEGLCDIFGMDEHWQPSIDEVLRFVHPEDADLAHAAAHTATDTGIVAAPLEYRIVRPDGQVRVVYREMDVDRDDAGRPVRRIVTFKDITELRAAQQRERELLGQLMHTQKLESLGTLAGGVAHELNNTLVPILALAKLALAELPPDCPTREDIETIASAGERARDLVQQILAFSRKQDQARREIDLGRIAHEAAQMLRSSLPTTIRIVETIEPTPIWGNAGEIHQVIVNLVTNAAQAIGTGKGTITVSVAATATGACLSVTDTGCGMDKATAARVFEPFFTTKGVGEGTGLGLSVVHGIVSAHGGRVNVASWPGEGTTFAVMLPPPSAADCKIEAIAA